ncbi:MAG: tyrosine--tRNA ligase [Candidatus Heimdallarchaeaceae archaeon]
MNLEDQIRTIERGTVDIIGRERVPELLKEGRKLNIKFGIDPTAPDIHLGHTVPLQKLRQFQEMGHNIHLIIGDYTAMIGDPSGRSDTRPMLTPEQIAANVRTYATQVFKLLDPNRTELLYNSQWLGKFSATDLIHLTSKYTVQQLLQRRDFSNRIKENCPLSVAELIYPLLVGYDSVYLKTDIEIGGTDQLFNFLASRAIQEAYGQKPEVVLTLPLLEGTDGVRKMSKSLGNAIGVTDEPFDMYGKIMSINDTLMIKYFELLSDVSVDELDSIKRSIEEGIANPMTYKQQLAREIVIKYHGLEAAVDAEKKFNKIHRRKELPEFIEQTQIPYSSEEDLNIITILRRSGRVSSNSEARRLLQQGGVRIDGDVIKDLDYSLKPEDGTILQVGKRYFRELQFKKE